MAEKKGRCTLRPQVIDKILKLLGTGMSRSQIAKTVGCHPNTVTNIKDRYEGAIYFNFGGVRQRRVVRPAGTHSRKGRTGVKAGAPNGGSNQRAPSGAGGDVATSGRRMMTTEK